MTRVLCAGIAATFLAPAGAAAANPEPDSWSYSLTVATVRMPEVDLDAGGETRLTSHHLRAGADRDFGDASELEVAVRYDVHEQRFSGAEGFGALAPWDTTHRVGIAASINTRTSFGWSYGIRPFASWAFESGAFADDAMSYGLAAAVLAGLSRDRRFGAGATVYRNMDGSIKASPMLFVHWRLNETWSIGNPREANFTSPSGLELRYSAGENWRIAWAGIYQSSEYRLDDRGLAPGGKGEGSAIVSYLRVTRRWASGISINGYLGAVFNGELEVEGADGSELASSKYDTAPFAALSVEGSF